MNPEVRPNLNPSFFNSRRKLVLAGSALLALAAVTQTCEKRHNSQLDVNQENYIQYLSTDPDVSFVKSFETYNPSKHYLRDLPGYLHRGSNLEMTNKKTGDHQIIDSQDKLFSAIYPIMNNTQLIAYVLAANVDLLSSFSNKEPIIEQKADEASISLWDSPYFGCGSRPIQEVSLVVDLKSGHVDKVEEHRVGSTNSRICTD